MLQQSVRAFPIKNIKQIHHGYQRGSKEEPSDFMLYENRPRDKQKACQQEENTCELLGASPNSLPKSPYVVYKD
jgi:hypothetical protein